MLLWGQRAALCGCRLQCCDFLTESGDFPNPLLTKATDDKSGDFLRCCYKRFWFGDSDLKARYHGCFHGAAERVLCSGCCDRPPPPQSTHRRPVTQQCHGAAALQPETHTAAPLLSTLPHPPDLPTNIFI